MRTAELIQCAVALALAAAIGCNRAETNEQADRAAAEVRTAAAKAGDTLADGWLTTRIQAQYFADNQVKARYIDVTSMDGVVTIKGFVETPAARERALQIARATSGVKQVNDQLLIGQSPKAFEASQGAVATSGATVPAVPPAGAPVDDSRITSAIQARYFLEPTIKARRIDVDTHAGVVTLAGNVGSESERSDALTLARTTDGVQRVEDHLTVDAAIDQATDVSGAPPAADDSALTTSIRAALGADPQLRGVAVTSRNGVVQLQGTVASAAVRQRALEVTRQTPGVAQVIDRLSIGR